MDPANQNPAVKIIKTPTTKVTSSFRFIAFKGYKVWVWPWFEVNLVRSHARLGPFAFEAVLCCCRRLQRSTKTHEISTKYLRTICGTCRTGSLDRLEHLVRPHFARDRVSLLALFLQLSDRGSHHSERSCRDPASCTEPSQTRSLPG